MLPAQARHVKNVSKLQRPDIGRHKREDAMIDSNKRTLAARAALLASSALLTVGTPAFGQTEAPAAEDDTAIADIVVTAQRREESLQDVPLSITAISGQDLRNADLRDITRLEQAVPGLRIGRSGPAGRPAIRGVFTEAIQANADPRVGFYIDEIYQSRAQQTIGAFVDLERVEVQKGPQGTLFGRNSLGGNIAVSSAKPRDELDYGIAGIYGNYDRIKLEGFLNVPIADGVAFRIAGALDRHDPYQKSIVNSRASTGDLDYQYVRGSLRFLPPGADDKLEVVIRGSYFHEDDRGNGSFNGKNVGAIVDSSLIRQPGQNLTFNGVTYPFPFGYNGGNYATGVRVPFSPVFRDAIPDIGGADIGIPLGGPYTLLFDFPATNKIKATNASVTIAYDLSENIRLRSITGFADFFFANEADGDGGPIPFSEFYFITKAKTLTQELQVQSADASDPLQYTFGAFYMDDKIGEGSGTIFPRHDYSTVTAAANGFPVLYASGSNCGFTFSPLVAPFSCNLSNFNSADGASPVKARTKSYAGYGQVSYTIDEKLTLTAGARYTVDDKDYRQAVQAGGAFTAFVGPFVTAQNAAFLAANPAATQAQLPFPGDASAATLTRPGGVNAGFTNGTGYHAEFPFNNNRADFANLSCGGITPGPFAAAGSNTVVGTVPNYFLTRCGKRKFKYWTYRVAADYQITPDNMVYASYSTGKHSGGFGASFTPATTPQGTFATFDTESVDAIEIGTKNSFFDKRLQVNAAIFYNKYKDNQVQGLQFVETGPNTGINIATITNLGDTKAPGAELQIIAKPVSRLTVRAAVNYLRARNTVEPLGIFTSGLCTISTGAGSPCAVNFLPNSAGLGSGFFPNPATNPELFVPFTNSAGVTTQFGSLFFGKKTKVQNSPDWSANFGASYEIDLGDTGTLTPEFDVLYSGKYLLSASVPNFQQEAYAKVDLRLTYRDADNNFSVQAFVQNLTQKATLGRVTTATLSASGTYSDPRTYGLRVGYRF
jgi:iron complex outermembrane recepter protein